MNEINESLRENLILFLEELDKEGEPSRGICIGVRSKIIEYMELLQKRSADKMTEGETFQKGLRFNDVNSANISDAEVISRLEANENNVDLLYELALKKAVLVNEKTKSQFKSLVESGLATVASYNTDSLKEDYYILTSKGWECSKRKSIIMRYRKKEKNILPEKLHISNEKMDFDSFTGIVSLKKYYEKNNQKGYMIFPFSDTLNLTMGIRISAQEDVEYEFAWDSESENVNSYLSALHRICKTDEVKKVIGVVRTETEKKELKKQIGQDFIISDKLNYYVLEG